jgi:hypothetical protein
MNRRIKIAILALAAFALQWGALYVLDARAQTPATPQSWKGVLMRYDNDAIPAAPPVQTTGWGAVYTAAQYGGTSEQAYAHCKGDVDAKAAELNVIYIQTEMSGMVKNAGRWTGACVPWK